MVGSAAYSATSIVVVMAKDKGRGSKGAKGGASSGQVSDRRPAPRITSNVKHNLRVLKFWKDYERKQTTGRQPATRFRQKKVMKEVLPDDTDFYEDPSATLICTNDGLEIASPVILVDGYNVCGYWGKLKNDFLNGNQGIARQMLIDELVSFSAVREVKVVVVFDAALSGQPTHTETYRGLKLWWQMVVQRSGLLRQMYWSNNYHMIKESEQELDEELKETRSTSLQGKIFQNKLKPKVVQSLKALRNQLEEQERRKK